MTKNLRRKGFTLVELLVVIAIISLLSSIILASFNYAKKRARDVRVITHLTTICKALEAYYIENGHYPYVGCSSSGQLSSEHYGKYRDNPHDDPLGDEVFDVLQPHLGDIIKPYVPNDPDAHYPDNDWSYFYDNYYDSVNSANTPETTECNDQAFQLLGYIEVSAPPFEWELAWGDWAGHGWWRACKAYPH